MDDFIVLTYYFGIYTIIKEVIKAVLNDTFSLVACHFTTERNVKLLFVYQFIRNGRSFGLTL